MKTKFKPFKLLADNRTMKIVSANKEHLKNAIVVISVKSTAILGSDTVEAVGKIAEAFNKIEPSGYYFVMASDDVSDLSMSIYDKADFKNKNLLVTTRTAEDADLDVLEAEIMAALSSAKSVTFVHKDIEITEQ